MTRYVFVGAGAIGSALGGLLAHRGHDVLLVARGAHARAVTEHGLRLRCPDLAVTVPVPTITTPDDAHLTVDDVLVLTTKTQQAAAALGAWADAPVHDRAGTVVGAAGAMLPVLVALNGVAGEDIALRWFDHVLGVCVWCPVVMIEPGEVIVRSAPLRGIFHLGRHAGPSGEVRARVRDDWGPAGLRVELPDDVLPWKYRKLLGNLLNALQALLGDLTGTDDVQAALREEAEGILSAAGVTVVDEQESRTTWDALTVGTVPGQPAELGGSSWQSLVRGTGTIETDYLNGEIALIARRIGRSAPRNAALAALARDAARHGRPPGSIGADDVRARLGL